MLRRILIVTTFSVMGIGAGAQIPSTPPSPTPPPPPADTVWRPAPSRITPATPRAPRVWSVTPDADFDLVLPAMPDLPPLPTIDMPDLYFNVTPAVDLERNFDFDLDRSFDFESDFNFDFDWDRVRDRLNDFDIEIPDVPMAPLEPIRPMEPIGDIAPIPPIPPITMAPITIAPMAVARALDAESLVAIPLMSDRLDPVAAMAADRARETIERVAGRSPFERQFSGISTEPPKAWAQSDPADSLYRTARETLNRGEYRRAAELFSAITQRFPNSAYAADARYWRAFALYRIGGQAELRDALRSLQEDGRRYYQASLQRDAAVLATRISGALAAQGDRQAAELVSRQASTPTEACDREDLAVRVEALNSLGQTDPESTTPILRRLLARRDDCSAPLRRAALYLLARRKDADAVNLIVSAARNDADMRVRAEALRFLAGIPGDQAAATLEELARTPGNEELQSAAIAALARSDNPRAKQALRSVIERTDVSENLRATALASIDADHTTDNGAYLRSIYPKLETPRLRSYAIRSIARIGGPENDQWLLSVVRNQNEAVDMRTTALRYAGRSAIPIRDLISMYDGSSDRPIREQLVSLFAQRNEPEATDKLLEIARRGTDPDMRRMAISALSRKNDPRTKQLLLEIIDK